MTMILSTIFFAPGRLTGIFVEICINPAWEYIERYINYPRRLVDHVKAVKEAAEDLQLVKHQLNRRVLVEMKDGKQMSGKVQLWFWRTDRTTATADELVRRGEAEEDSLCLAGFCSTSWLTTSNVVQELDKCLKMLRDLISTGEVLIYTEVVVEAPPRESSSSGGAPVASENAPAKAEEADGWDTLMHEVLHCLKQGDHMIGVWGQGGAGKSILLEQINQHFVGSKDFSVVWIDVPRDMNIVTIQQAMGEKMDVPIELKHTSIAQKAAHISKILKTKKIILLLDDVRGPIDLNQIGVPPLEDLTWSKIVFTTRLEQVCTKMKPQPEKSLLLQPLTEEQAWKLFLKHSGKEAIYNNPAILKFARTLVKECRGLPLALTIMGKRMSGKMDPEDWSGAIVAFRDDMGDQLSSILKYSYDHLPHQTAKSCFLYCALYPEGFPILKSELLELWTSEKDFWVDETDDPRSSARRVLRSLVHARLLDDHGECVTMHKMIRRMALELAQPDALVMAGEKLEEALDVASWEGKKMVSLMHSNIEELIEVPTCPTLFTLLLNKNQQLLDICQRFFESMSNLTVLNLSCTGIEELPRSLSSLVSLEHLDISYTEIKRLPMVLRELVKLKHFDVNGLCLSFKRLDRLICYMASLQVLKMVCDYCYDQEDGEITMHDLSDGEILIEELQHLERLTVLQITINSFSSLEKLIATTRLSRRTQTLCFRHYKASSVDVSLLENIENIESLFVTRCDFKELYANSGIYTPPPYTSYRSFSSITRVVVNNCQYLEHLTCLVLMPNLRILEVSSCLILGEILNGDKLRGILWRDRHLEPFSNLVVLELCLLPSLENISSTSLPLRFLYELRVSGCPRLKKLPLNLNSVMGCSIQLTADDYWFEEIEWEDDETRDAMRARFNFSPDITSYTRNIGLKQTVMMWPRQR